MDCRTTSTTRSNRRQSALTLVEFLLVLGLCGIVLVGVLSLAYFSARSFSALTNYVDLDNYSRNALDQMTREIRQANALTYATTHELRFSHTDPADGSLYTVAYVYSPGNRTLARLVTRGGTTVRTELLRECDYLKFSTFQRNILPGTWDQYPTADLSTTKLVQLSWICSRTILGARVNTESVQSAKVVIRKK
jgi:hypothetical protein